jgi:mRNA deadenylase 3'-5' endonuclease subunit Ccr4
MGFSEIDKTLKFVKNLTLEPPFSFYGKGLMSLVDYIFYNGNILPIRSLNIPDINKIAFDIGYLPNEHFPSDHISLCADFQILK